MTYHVSEAYESAQLPIEYEGLTLPESEAVTGYRGPPPAEDMVLVPWYESDGQLNLARDNNGFMYVRLGRRRGSFHVHPNLARTRHVLMRTRGGLVASGLLRLREPGFRVFTRSQLRNQLSAQTAGKGVEAWSATAGADDEEYIYALFKTQDHPHFAGAEWRGDELTDQIERFESDARNKLVENVGRTSPYPRLLPLAEVLRALKPRPKTLP